MRFAFSIVVAAICLAPAAASAQPQAAIARDTIADVMASAAFTRDSTPESLYGFRGTVAFNFKEHIAIVAEGGWAAGKHPVSLAAKASDNETAFLGGLRIRRFDDLKYAPYFQGLAGVSKRTDTQRAVSRSSFAVRTDVGIDIALAKRVAARAGLGFTYLFNDVRYQNEFGATVGLTVGLGKK